MTALPQKYSRTFTYRIAVIYHQYPVYDCVRGHRFLSFLDAIALVDLIVALGSDSYP
jgi:hypothetical protein